MMHLQQVCYRYLFYDLCRGILISTTIVAAWGITISFNVLLFGNILLIHEEMDVILLRSLGGHLTRFFPFLTGSDTTSRNKKPFDVRCLEKAVDFCSIQTFQTTKRCRTDSYWLVALVNCISFEPCNSCVTADVFWLFFFPMFLACCTAYLLSLSRSVTAWIAC